MFSDERECDLSITADLNAKSERTTFHDAKLTQTLNR